MEASLGEGGGYINLKLNVTEPTINLEIIYYPSRPTI